MADPGPKVNVPVIDPSQYLSEVAKGLHRIVQDAFRDGYRMGYGEAEGKAIARIIEVVRSSAAGQDAAAQLTETRPRDAPGARLKEMVVEGNWPW